MSGVVIENSRQFEEQKMESKYREEESEDEEVYSESDSEEEEEVSGEENDGHYGTSNVITGGLSLMRLLTRNINQIRPEKRQHLDTDLHHTDEQEFYCSEDEEDEAEEEEDEKLSEMVNQRTINSTLNLMNMLLLKTAGFQRCGGESAS